MLITRQNMVAVMLNMLVFIGSKLFWLIPDKVQMLLQRPQVREEHYAIQRKA